MGSEVGGCNILMRESEARKNTKLQGGYRNSQTFHHVNFFKIIFAELNYFLLVFRLGILNSRNKIKFIKASGNIDMWKRQEATSPIFIFSWLNGIKCIPPQIKLFHLWKTN